MFATSLVALVRRYLRAGSVDQGPCGAGANRGAVARLHVPGAATVRAYTTPRLVALPYRRRRVGRALVCRADGTSAGLRLHLLLAAPRRTIPRPVRPRETSLVLPAPSARRYAAVDSAVAGFRSFPGPA